MAQQNNISESGFSLIELMIVVAIIGILSTVAIPNFGRFVDKAKISRVKAEVSSIDVSIHALQALYGFYPNSNGNWVGAMPNALEYPINCTTVTYGLGSDQDQAIRDLCAIMSSLNPIAQGLPEQSPACGEPRDYLYRSNGADYQIMGYCFDHAELSGMALPQRCGGGMCWGVSIYSVNGSAW